MKTMKNTQITSEEFIGAYKTATPEVQNTIKALLRVQDGIAEIKQEQTVDAMYLEDVSRRVGCGVALGYAVLECMDTGENTPESYLDAFMGLCMYFDALREGLALQVDTMLKG